jgi:hypothetical protein
MISFTSAPLSNIARTTFALPLAAAAISAVLLVFCLKKVRIDDAAMSIDQPLLCC